MTCPNCGRSNPADNVYCARCGFRLPNAAARGAGITYRRTEQTEPAGGGGQGLLAFGAVLVAGLLFAGGAVALLLFAPPGATPTPISGANRSPESSLPIFVQPTPTPTVPPTASPVPSFFGSIPLVSPSGLIESPTPIVGPTPTIVPTPTPTPTRTPTATPPGPATCAQADGSTMQTLFLGYGNDRSRGPIPRGWCIHRVTIRPFQEFGKARLVDDGRRIAAYTCHPDTCKKQDRQNYSPPRAVAQGSILAYRFTCEDNPGTEVDECNDGLEGGATIEIEYEVLAAP